jgi:Methyltransferase domain
MADAERFVDRLPANNSYVGGAARVYDAWMPPGTVFDDDVVHQETIRRAGGTGLELASGNGRFLIPALEAGLDVQGIDNSPAMLEICQKHATERGLDVVLHEGDMAPLALDRRFHAIVCPAGSYSLITDEDTALTALASYFEHLEPVVDCRSRCSPLVPTTPLTSVGVFVAPVPTVSAATRTWSTSRSVKTSQRRSL